ncbi:lipopolysaccharide biosynthesis protein [Roseateles paludis]|uniref:Lipopolysaccharide biosynthesis protein n=1 Tax=Roseateles paludis TaxID=3145238 RepID=A0ABV0G010_9BURK
MSDKNSGSFGGRTVSNVAWLGGSQFLRQGISIGASLLIARLLAPSDYGVFAMTVFVNELAQLLINFGMGAALVQREKLEERALSTTFWFQAGLGVVAGLAMVAAGPWIADYFKQPVLRWLMVTCALNVFVSAISVVPNALFTHRLDMREIAVATFVGSIIGALVAVQMSYLGFGVWALAMQPLAGSTATTAYLFWRVRWWPQLIYDRSEVQQLLGFSGYLLGSNILSHITKNLQSLILGPALGVAALGLMTMAQTVVWLPLAQISQTMVKATFPVFSKLQNDPPRARSALYRASGAIGLLSFPLLAGIAALASDLMPVVFGVRWTDSGPLVAVLATMAMVKSATTLSDTVLMSTGRTSRLMHIAVVSLPVMAGALWLFSKTDIFQATVAYSVTMVVLQVATQHYALRSIGGGWLEFLTPMFKPLLGTALMVLALLFTSPHLQSIGGWSRLTLLSLMGAAIYIAWTWLANRAALTDLIATVKSR